VVDFTREMSSIKRRWFDKEIFGSRNVIQRKSGGWGSGG
jgi:hypothetical protein